ncbi:MAG TPA: hypothetical protein VK046_15415 [Actinomycetaceae bacterium]|nr:hypothetical protein [Actinomycetaceae bacterium]
MTDIVIDEDYLRTTASDLDGLSSDLTRMCSQIRGLDGLVVGAAPVFDELHEFAGAWAGAAEDLAEYADGGATYVRAILESFDELDLRLAEVFTNRELESH